jgi:DNA-binding transcriptional regulator YiaG
MTKIREYREKIGLTQEAFAARLRVSIHTARSWDQGQRSPKRSRVKEIAKLLKCDPVELL